MADRTMPDQRMQPRVAGQHFPGGARGRIALKHDGEIFTEPIEHEAMLPYPTELLNY